MGRVVAVNRVAKISRPPVTKKGHRVRRGRRGLRVRRLRKRNLQPIQQHRLPVVRAIVAIKVVSRGRKVLRARRRNRQPPIKRHRQPAVRAMIAVVANKVASKVRTPVPVAVSKDKSIAIGMDATAIGNPVSKVLVVRRPVRRDGSMDRPVARVGRAARPYRKSIAAISSTFRTGSGITCRRRHAAIVGCATSAATVSW